MEKVNLKAFKREEKIKPAAIREEGFLPAVLYGNKVASQALKVKKNEFEKVYSQAGENTLVELEIDGEKPLRVLIYDVQKEAVKDKISHVDFYQVDMKKKVTTEIPLEFVGESKAVKELGGAFIKNMDSIEIECLPDDLVSEIKVDISVLTQLEDSLKVKDINFPAGITPTAEEDQIIASVIEPKVEEEPAAPVSVEDVEVIGKGKEGEEGKDGAGGKEEKPAK